MGVHGFHLFELLTINFQLNRYPIKFNVHRYILFGLSQRHNTIREIYSQIDQYIITLTHHCLDLVS